MAKPKGPVDVGDSIEIILRSGARTPGTVVTVRGGMIEAAFRGDNDRSTLAVLDERAAVAGDKTRWAFDLAYRPRR